MAATVQAPRGPPRTSAASPEDFSMTREEFSPILVYLSAAVNREIPREQAEVYFDCLSDLPATAIRQAARRAVLESEYPVVPAVGRIRRLALEELALRESPADNVARIARERAEG